MNFKVTYKDFDTALRAKKMFELRRDINLHIINGEFKKARSAQKQLAKDAVEDFETYKTLPHINFTNIPFKEWISIAIKSLKFRIFKAFTKNTPEEKLLAEKYSKYAKTLTSDDKNKNTINIVIPSLY